MAGKEIQIAQSKSITIVCLSVGLCNHTIKFCKYGWLKVSSLNIKVNTVWMLAKKKKKQRKPLLESHRPQIKNKIPNWNQNKNF